jgi:hypothetical protein
VHLTRAGPAVGQPAPTGLPTLRAAVTQAGHCPFVGVDRDR